MLRQLITLLGIAIALSASGCGDQTPVLTSANTAEGLWFGTTNTNRTLTAAVLDDGTYYFFYSVAANPNQIAVSYKAPGPRTTELRLTKHERLRYWRDGAGCDHLCQLCCTPVPKWFNPVLGSGHGDVHQFLQHRV
jgi:hypothetical protein